MNKVFEAVTAWVAEVAEGLLEFFLGDDDFPGGAAT